MTHMKEPGGWQDAGRNKPRPRAGTSSSKAAMRGAARPVAVAEREPSAGDEDGREKASDIREIRQSVPPGVE
jgi:hypothetical protein